MSERQALIADRYRLLYRVGSGGMGVVWEALDERLERHVAVKQLRRQSDASTAEAELANKRAMREARLTARLQHPNAVPVFDAVELNDDCALREPSLVNVNRQSARQDATASSNDRWAA